VFQPLLARAMLLFLAVVLCLLSACKPKAAPQKGAPQQIAAQQTQLVVFAAASLRGVFSAIGEDFKRNHPGTEVVFNFAGTQELRTQVEHGARADVFASADHKHMTELVKAGSASSPVTFAKNEPVLAVSKDAASKIKQFADLAAAERIVVGVPDVPIGRYTIQILDRASKALGADFRSRVESHIVSKELNVRQIFAKVSLGEADAAIVYRTDVQGADANVRLVAIPAEFNVIAEYPIATLSNAAHPTLAKAWLDMVTSASGRALLEKAGFIAP
jgi:molybdate transport system substrate-binding protein